MGSAADPRRQGGDAASAPPHLAASLRVLFAHLPRKDMTIAKARETIVHVAACMEAGMAGPAMQSLPAQLEGATGCAISELAAFVEQWQDHQPRTSSSSNTSLSTGD